MSQFIDFKKKYHNAEILSSKEEELTSQWRRNIVIPKDRMQEAVDALDNSEKDVLNEVREALTWKTILSLAYKYYPLYPHRKLWLEALRRAKRWARFINIVYLLLTLRTIMAEKAAERKRTLEGLSIDTGYNKRGVYQLIQLNDQRLEARRLAKLAVATEGGAIG